MRFSYYMTQRPAMPGAQPREGLIEVEELNPNTNTPGVGRAYARITYDRQLGVKEIIDYELIADTDANRQNKVNYNGYSIEYNPVLDLWDTYECGSLAASTYTLDEAKAAIDEIA